MSLQRGSSYFECTHFLSRLFVVLLIAGVCFLSQVSWAQSLCSKTQNIGSIAFLKLSDISPETLEDSSVIKSMNLVQMLLEERKRLYTPGAWSGEALQEITAITGETKVLSKSIYLGVIDRLIEYESQDLIFLTARAFDQKLSPWGLAEKNTHFMRSLMLGFYMVEGHVDLNIQQYRAMADIADLLKNREWKEMEESEQGQILELAERHFPGTLFARNAGFAMAASKLKAGKPCCGHGCGGCFKYKIKSALEKMNEAPAVGLPLHRIIEIRQNRE